MSAFDHPFLIQRIRQPMTSLRKAQLEAMRGFGQLAKAPWRRARWTRSNRN